MVAHEKRALTAFVTVLLACALSSLAFALPAHAETDPGSDSPLAPALLVDGETDPDSLDWEPVMTMESPDDIGDGTIPHYAMYMNINMAFNRYKQERLDYYAQHPEEVEGMEEWEINNQAHVDAMWKLEKIRHSLEEDMVIEYFVCLDTPDPQYKVKKVMTNSESTTVLYFPRDAGGPDDLDDESQYVMEAHDYYRPVWTWEDEDTAYCDFYCMLGQEDYPWDGTNDYDRVYADSITKTVITEPTELTDGEVECTASVIYPESYTFLPTEFTNTKNFPIPATGNPERITITQEPQDVTLNYPEGATFHVEIDRPDLLVSYQWVQEDPEGRVKVLDGTTATTDTLVWPATECWLEEMYLYCVITDVNGNKIASRRARLYIPNFTEEKPVLFVGDRAVEPGETLDLSTTPVGSGIVTFDADGLNITFDNVNVHTSDYEYDMQRAPSEGVYLRAFSSGGEKYVFHLIGDNVINNEYLEEDTGKGGVAFNADVHCDTTEEMPMIRFEGDGTLTLRGGSNSIYVDVDLEIDADIKTETGGEHNCVGIEGNSLHICPGANIEIGSCGAAIVAMGNLFIEDDAQIKVDSTGHYAFTGNAEEELILVGGNMVCNKATIDINAHADPNMVLPNGKIIDHMYAICCNNAVALYGTELNITMDAEDADEDYAGGFRAISGKPFKGLYMYEGAKVNIRIASDAIHGAEGIVPDSGQYATVEMEDGSELLIEIRTSGEVLGIDLPQALKVVDSTVKVTTASADGGTSMGFVGSELDVELNDATNELIFTATDGLAIFVTDPDVVDAAEYDPDYKSALTYLTGIAKITTPTAGVVSPYGFELASGTIPGETVYDPAAPDAPVQKAVIAGDDSQDEPVSYYASEGDGLVWDKGSGIAARFVFKRTVGDEETIGHFTGVLVDGVVVDQANYTATVGSVAVEFTSAYLETLAAGKHVITAQFDDFDEGATASFTIREASKPDDGGSGGDSGGSDKGSDKSSGGDSGGSDKDPAKGSSSSSSSGQAPRTGDDTPFGALLLTAALACAVLIVSRSARNCG